MRFAEVRIDTWVETGMVVTPFYDSLIAKLMVHAADRPAAIAKLLRALSLTQVHNACELWDQPWHPTSATVEWLQDVSLGPFPCLSVVAIIFLAGLTGIPGWACFEILSRASMPADLSTMTSTNDACMQGHLTFKRRTAMASMLL